MALELSRYTERMISGLYHHGDWEKLTDENKEKFIRGCEELSAQSNGMVIFVKRRWLKPFSFGYCHYGIYVKKPFGPEMVIHYTPEGGGDFKGIIRETSLDEFLDNASDFEIRTFSSKQYPHIYSGEETVQRARSMLGSGGYNLIFNNCEHFATWCKTGVRTSSQSNTGIGSLIGVALVTVVAGAFGGAFNGFGKA